MNETILNLPPEVRFGFGAINSLAYCLNRASGTRVALITDPGIASCGLLDQVIDILKDAGIAYFVYDAVRQNPSDTDCRNGLEVFRKGKCDCLLAIGGGSPMDAAKGIQLLSTHEGDLAEYDVMADGIEKIEKNLPPVIAVPTTAGTGSEVSAGAVIIDEEKNQKIVIVSSFLIPTVAIVDPAMTMKLPRDLTAATGVDALTHGIEVYVSMNDEPLIEAMMLYAIRLCRDYLPRVVKDGSDTEARKWMAYAAAIAGMGINVKGLGVCHSLSHQLSTDFQISHGLANAVMIPYVMRVNCKSALDKYAAIAEAMGVDSGTDSKRELAELGIDRVICLVKDLGISLNLSSYGVTEDSVESMASKAMNDPCHSGNPRTCDVTLMKDLYLSAIRGAL